MALSARDRAIAEYRYQHGIPAACQHFNIKKRRVQQACENARLAGVSFAAPAPAGEPAPAPAVVTPAFLVSLSLTPPALPHPDDVADDDTTWVCPWSAESFPIVPGTRYADWFAERQRMKRLASLRLVVERDKPRKVLHCTGAAEDALDGDPVPLGGGLGGAVEDAQEMHFGSACGSVAVLAGPAVSDACAAAPRRTVKVFRPGLLPLLVAAIGRLVAENPLPWGAALVGLLLIWLVF